MPMSPFVAGLRAQVGTSLLLLPSVSVLCRDAQGRVLMVRQLETGSWGVPGGAIEPDEEPEAAAAREVLEESGAVVAIERLVTVVGGPRCRTEYANGDRLAFVAVVYEARMVGGELAPDGEETSAVGWFALEELGGLALGAFTTLLLETSVLTGR
jgi:ADP-ribose pyrophosphatase YjhB (NUDIX family)